VQDSVYRGLVVRVWPSGKASFLVRLKDATTGRWYWWTLGTVADLTVESARELAADARGQTARAKHGMAVDPRQERQQQAQIAERTVTLRTFIDEKYAAFVRTNQKRGEETLTTITNRCADFLDLPLTEITPFAVERWRSAYLKRKKKPATVNRVLTALKACLSKAVEWRIVDRHPLAGLKLAKVDRIGRLRFLSPDEQTRLLAALAARDEKRRKARAHHNEWLRERGYPERPVYGTYTDHLTPLVITLLHTGIRFGEACALTWADVDLVGALLTVRGETAKTNTTRHVPLNKTVSHMLKAWKPAKVEADAYVFPGREDGQKLTDIKTAWRELLRSVEGKAIAGFRVHDLRHTFASTLVQNGVDLNTVRELLGHTDIKMTLRYSHLAPKHLAEAVAKIG
jgi:integrase